MMLGEFERFKFSLHTKIVRFRKLATRNHEMKTA